MDEILNAGNDIGDWETKEITNLNIIYAEAEKQLRLGYKMYNIGLLLETFVIFMRVTKLYDLVKKNSHLIIPNKRHFEFKKNITKIIVIMEMIKPKLIKQYEKNCVSVTISDSSDNNNELQEKMIADLEARWSKLMPKPK